MYGNMKRILLPSPLKNNNNKVKIIIKPNLKTTNNLITVFLKVKNLTICEYLKQYYMCMIKCFIIVVVCKMCNINEPMIYHRFVLE